VRYRAARRRHSADQVGLAVLIVAGLVACELVHRGERSERISLVPGAVLARSFQGERAYRFRFETPAGRFLHLAVDQRGVDVVVLLRDPAGRLIYEVDSPTGRKGEETVLAVTETAGEHALVVEPFARGATGDFALEVREVRPARPEDRRRAAAAAPFARGERRRLEGKPELAAAAYREALPLLERSGEPARLAEAEWRLGQALGEIGDLRQARTVLERAAERFHAQGDELGQARALNDLGDLRRTLGETLEALAAHERALALYRRLGNLSGTGTSLNDAGLVLETRGDLQGAIERYQQALALWRRLGARPSEAATLENLGSLYSLLGYDREALDLLERSLELVPQDRPTQRSSALVALGWAEYLAGRPERALERYQAALALAGRSGSRMAEAGIWDRRGTALRVLHRYPEAAGSYARALELSRAAGSGLGEGHTLANLGWLDLESGAIARGRERLARAAQLLARSGDPNGEVYAHVGLSRADRSLGALGAARGEAELAVRLVEEMRAALRGAMSRGQYLATRFDAYEELVSVLMDLDRSQPGRGHDREALAVAERARARNLMDELADGGGHGRADLADPRRVSLLAEIHALEERRRVLASRDPRDARLAELDASLRARSLELDRSSPPSPAVPTWAPASVPEMQALADERSLLVVYMLAEPRSFAWTVDRGSVVSHVLPGRERIERLARQVLGGLSEGPEIAPQGSVDTALAELSQAILAPLAGRLAGRPRLAILADGALHLVPFGALPSPEAARSGRDREPLVVDHEIAMIPSATFLRWQRQRLAGRPPAPGVVAVLADPVFSPSDGRVAAGAPPPSTPPASGGGGPRPFAGSLERLPHTAEEARAIVRLAAPGRALLATGTRASRELVESGALRGFSMLHFATHGMLDPVLPERSGIVLSQVDEHGRRRDGFLSAPGVAALDLPAELAVLSGCETGLGREVRGEGLVGLTQAFFRAGTRRVVVSFWKVRDRATAELMERFYRGMLAERLSPAAALRAAQRSLRREARWHEPHYWAGFSLEGDWR
jgi:CHAT domain-containing protein/Tfp pilus assembly protein PilF